MANVKISALPTVTSVVPSSDVLPLVSGGITTKATPSAIVTAALAAPGPIGGTTPAAITGTTVTATTFVAPTLKAANSAGVTFQNASGVAQLQLGSGGGSNISLEVATNINPANAAVSIAPTGTGTLTVNPATAGTMNNVAIGGTTAAAGTFTALTATGNTILGDASSDTITLNAGTVTLNNSTTISAASAKTLALNGGAGSNGLILDASNNVTIGTSSVVQKVTVNGGFATNGSATTPTLDTTGNTASYANGATANFSNFSGVIIVNNLSTGAVTMYVCGGGGVVQVATSSTAQGVVAFNSGIDGYTWTNNTGGAISVSFATIRTRVSG